jgi:amphi-Trp domain-containing protein
MSKSKPPFEFEHESIQDPSSVVRYFEALSQGFEAGRLLFCWGKKELVLKPEDLMNFSVKAKRKDGEVKVTIRVSWKEPDKAEKASEPLIIRPIETEEEG